MNAYQIRISVFDQDGEPITRGGWSEPVVGDLDALAEKLESKGSQLDYTDEGFNLLDRRSVSARALQIDVVFQVTEYRYCTAPEWGPPEEEERRKTRRYRRFPKACYFRREVEWRRQRFYDMMERVRVADEAAARPRADLPPPGRAGEKPAYTHLAQVSENPKHYTDEWAKFDTSHPIEKMRVKGTLGENAAQAFRRYCAARVWFHFWLRSQGLGSKGEWLREHVDGTADPQAGITMRLDAAHMRLAVMDAMAFTPTGRKTMSQQRFDDLDSVCGYGRRLIDVARATNRDPKTVRKSLFAGLDAVCGFALWDKHLESVSVLYIRPFDKSA